MNTVWDTLTENQLRRWVNVGGYTVVMVVVQEKIFLVNLFLIELDLAVCTETLTDGFAKC